MPCLAKPLDPDAVAAPMRLAFERLQVQRLTKTYQRLLEDTTETVSNSELDALQISWGAPLDVDNLGARDPQDASSLFFSPCDWTQDSLDWESDSGSSDVVWMNFANEEPSLWLSLMCGLYRFSWFRCRLLALETISENVWKPTVRTSQAHPSIYLLEAIQERTGLELPHHEWKGQGYSRYEYSGAWVYFAEAAADKPHSVCVILDSSYSKDGVAARSEVMAAVRMTEFQLHGACYTHHFVKPVLVCTYFRNETARLTQVHFDMKSNRLVLRQSRVLDLSGEDAPPDAWLMLRWMASGPIGQTLYEPLTALPNPSGGDGAKRPPQVTVSG